MLNTIFIIHSLFAQMYDYKYANPFEGDGERVVLQANPFNQPLPDKTICDMAAEAPSNNNDPILLAVLDDCDLLRPIQSKDAGPPSYNLPRPEWAFEAEISP